jgi:hypothetical protein
VSRNASADADAIVEALMTMPRILDDVERHATSRVACSPTHAVRRVLKPKPRNCDSKTGALNTVTDPRALAAPQLLI